MRGHWTHGMSGTRIYQQWASMLARCRCPSFTTYEHYGGRGVIVCSQWLSFENFLADMGEPKFSNATLERCDNNGNYTPENCCWATSKQQARNKRNNLVLTLNGRSQCATAWADELGMRSDMIHNRKQYGWSDERALTDPKHQFATLEFQGEWKTILQWAVKFKMQNSTLYRRLLKGWSLSKALTTPLRGA